MKKNAYFRESGDKRAKKYFIYDSNFNFIGATNEKPEDLREIISLDSPRAEFYELERLTNGYGIIKGYKSLTDAENKAIADGVKPKNWR